MEAVAVLYDTPLFMQFLGSNSVQDLPPAKAMQFLCDAKGNHKRVKLSRTPNDKVVIRAANDDEELVVGANGRCFFESVQLGIGEEFNMHPMSDESLAFVSCRTANVLEIDNNSLPRCVDTIRRGWFLLDEDAAVGYTLQVVRTQSPMAMAACCHCEHEQAKERRQYVMELVGMQKSLDEIDDILARMYNHVCTAGAPIEMENTLLFAKKRGVGLPSKKCSWL